MAAQSAIGPGRSVGTRATGKSTSTDEELEIRSNGNEYEAINKKSEGKNRSHYHHTYKDVLL
jgi:hypothetical protein